MLVYCHVYFIARRRDNWPWVTRMWLRRPELIRMPTYLIHKDTWSYYRARCATDVIASHSVGEMSQPDENLVIVDNTAAADNKTHLHQCHQCSLDNTDSMALRILNKPCNLVRFPRLKIHHTMMQSGRIGRIQITFLPQVAVIDNLITLYYINYPTFMTV